MHDKNTNGRKKKIKKKNWFQSNGVTVVALEENTPLTIPMQVSILSKWKSWQYMQSRWFFFLLSHKKWIMGNILDGTHYQHQPWCLWNCSLKPKAIFSPLTFRTSCDCLHTLIIEHLSHSLLVVSFLLLKRTKKKRSKEIWKSSK